MYRYSWLIYCSTVCYFFGLSHWIWCFVNSTPVVFTVSESLSKSTSDPVMLHTCLFPSSVKQISCVWPSLTISLSPLPFFSGPVVLPDPSACIFETRGGTLLLCQQLPSPIQLPPLRCIWGNCTFTLPHYQAHIYYYLLQIFADHLLLLKRYMSQLNDWGFTKNVMPARLC